MLVLGDVKCDAGEEREMRRERKIYLASAIGYELPREKENNYIVFLGW
jgi:hypothetical protein